MTTQFFVLAGTKPFAIYPDKPKADTAAAALGTAGLTGDITVVEVICGSDEFAVTCDDYLKGKDAIISEVVTLLGA